MHDVDEKHYSSAVEQAEMALRAQLNYGGVHLDATQPLRRGVSRSITFDWQSGDLPDEIGQMRRLASAFNSLADALEDKG
ncbi:HAMP domain-containing protein, partial [Pseudoalteromonas sp. GABNS16H]|uniref:HAMP domain-containing protein n=1 Tax=Pseudoalteromonas sp. GABNS16H TaxID=3025325 RepID=UPI0023624BFB